MGKPHNTFKLVIISLILSIIVVASIAVVFMNYIAPSIGIDNEQLYVTLSTIFPLLIALVIFEIGYIRGANRKVKNKNPDDFSEAIMSAPATEKIVEVIKEVEVEKPVTNEVIKEVPVEVIKEVPVEVTVEVPVEVYKEVIKEIPVEKIIEKPVPYEVIKEVPVETIVEKEIYVDVIKEITVEKIVEVPKEIPVPYELVREVVVEKLVNAKPEAVFYDLNETIEEELKICKECGSNIAIALFKLEGDVTVDYLTGVYGPFGYVFNKGEDQAALLIPHATQDEADEIINANLDKIPGIAFVVLSMESAKLASARELVNNAEALF
ncbi:MAG: hypothetical protein K6G51_06075 [Sphaerochaetaceae bacterium]|nr:hypothetical protein [Sphaerochaetaceae bacterium]